MVLNPHENACCWKPWNLAKIRRNSVFLWENVRRRCPTSCSLQWPRILSKSVEKSVFWTQIHLLVDLRPPVSSILAESPIFDANSPQKILLKFDDVRAGQLCCRCSKVSQSTDVLTRWSTVSQMSWNVVCPIDSNPQVKQKGQTGLKIVGWWWWSKDAMTKKKDVHNKGVRYLGKSLNKIRCKRKGLLSQSYLLALQLKSNGLFWSGLWPSQLLHSKG